MALSIDRTNRQILVTSPQTDVQIQELLDFIRVEEASWSGIDHYHIAEASGNQPLGSSVFVGITLSLNDPWQIKFWDGNYVATISGGNLVGGIDGDPIAYSPGVQVVVLQSAAATKVVTGSGITEQDKADLIAAIFNQAGTSPIHADLRKVRGQTVDGAGTEADPWGPT